MNASGPSRAWLVGLLAFTLLFVSLSLFAKFELDSLREGLRQTAEAEIGRYFRSRAISIVGLRGLQVHDFNVRFNTPRGQAEISAPEALVLVDLLDLLYGEVTVERVQVDGATLRVTAPSPTLASEQATAAPAVPVAKPPMGFAPSAFRVIGKDCKVELAGFLPDKTLSFDPVAFEAFRLADSSDYYLAMQATLRGDEDVPFKVEGRFAAADNFDFKAQSPRITTAVVNALLSKPQDYVVSGAVAPSLHVEAMPGAPIEVFLQSAVVDFVAAKQPEDVPPFSGRIEARILYDRVARNARIADFRADGETVQGSARGTIDFSGDTPVFNLDAEATRIPLEAILARIKASPVEKYGKLDVTLAEPYRISGTLTGPSKAPSVTARLTAQHGTLAFDPAQKRWPSGALDVGTVDLSWDSTTRRPNGVLNVVGGKVEHAESGVSASDVSGTVHFEGDTIDAYPVQATVTGNTCAARLTYDYIKQDGSLDVSGALSGIEDTKLATLIDNTKLAGTAAVRATATKKGNAYHVEADVDATLTDVAYRWYFDKAPGMGGIGSFKIDFLPKKSVELEGDIVLAMTPLKAKLSFKHDGKKYRLQRLTADAEQLDVAAVGRCVSIPYYITGGTGTDGHYAWTRRSVEGQTWEASATVKIDEIFMQAVGKKSLMHLRGADFNVLMDKGDAPTGKLVLKAEQAYMPSLREEWFVPVTPDPKLFPDYTPQFETWEYRLAGDYVEVPPWKGTNFKGEAFTKPARSGLRSYSADIDGGRIQGSYDLNRPENAYVTTVEWTNVPSHYFLEHLRFSDVLSGPTTGRLTYSLDRDDPGTMEGKGNFEVNDGKFSEEFLYSKLQGKTAGGGVTLPSLHFSRLKTGIEFKNDIVRTPDADLQAEGVHVQGSGQFVIGGDMDYELKVAISPETATQIPMLMQSFNVEGHRLSQQNIELMFKVTGPTGGPRGKLAEIPTPRVTLVSGALEMTSEAIKVIDVPRKILVDLLKLGGGLVGATK